jgi:hypothetical protein
VSAIMIVSAVLDYPGPLTQPDALLRPTPQRRFVRGLGQHEVLDGRQVVGDLSYLSFSRSMLCLKWPRTIAPEQSYRLAGLHKDAIQEYARVRARESKVSREMVSQLR